MVAAASLAAPGSARDIATPDWPCVQRKIVNVTSTQVWPGPAVDDMPEWYKDADISALVVRLADRRTPLDEAERSIKAFAAQQAEPARERRLILLFAGLFEALQRQRKVVIVQLEKYRRAQGQRALELERQGLIIAELEEKVALDPASGDALADAKSRFDIAQRIFQERQDNIPFACEIPVRIDARIFALGKAVFEQMPAAAASMAPGAALQ